MGSGIALSPVYPGVAEGRVERDHAVDGVRGQGAARNRVEAGLTEGGGDVFGLPVAKDNDVEGVAREGFDWERAGGAGGGDGCIGGAWGLRPEDVEGALLLVVGVRRVGEVEFERVGEGLDLAPAGVGPFAVVVGGGVFFDEGGWAGGKGEVQTIAVGAEAKRERIGDEPVTLFDLFPREGEGVATFFHRLVEEEVL